MVDDDVRYGRCTISREQKIIPVLTVALPSHRPHASPPAHYRQTLEAANPPNSTAAPLACLHDASQLKHPKPPLSVNTPAPKHYPATPKSSNT